MRIKRNNRSKVILIASAILAVLSISSPASAQNTYEIYTYGGGDYLYHILNGVAMIFAANHVTSLVSLAAILTVIAMIARTLGNTGAGTIYSGEGMFEMVKISVLTVAAVQVFCVPKANVLIQDRSQPSQTQVVANVPLVQAFTMYATSTIGEVIGEMMEDVFSLPDSIKFRNNGVGLGVKYVGEFMEIYPPDTNYVGYGGDYRPELLYNVIRQYTIDCLFPEFLNPNASDTHAAAFNAIFSSTDILNDGAIQTIGGSPIKQITGLRTDSPTMTCADALPNIRAAWNEVYSLWIDDITNIVAGKMGFEHGELFNSQDYIEQVFQHYIPSALSSKAMIMNVAMVNAVKDGMLVYSARTQSGSTFAEQLSKRKTTSGWMSAARMLNSIVVILRQIFEGLIYGLSVFLPLAFVIAGVSAFSTYVKLVFWLNLWVPFYIVLNLLADVRFAQAANDLSILASGAQGLTFRNIIEVQEQTSMIMGLIGATAWTVPALAWGVIQGGGAAFSAAIGGVTQDGTSRSTSTQVGSEVHGSDNRSIGGHSIGNENIRTSTPITSYGQSTAGYAAGMATRATVAEHGLGSIVKGATGNMQHNTGRGVGMGGNAFAAGHTGGQATVGMAQAQENVAKASGFSSVQEMSKAFGTMDNTRQASILKNVGQQMGLSSENAASWAGSVAGTQNAVGLLSYGDTLEQMGVSGLRAAGAAEGVIKSASTLAGLKMMQENGMTAKDFGGQKGQLDTAQAIGGIAGFQEAYNNAQQNGFTGNMAQFSQAMSAIQYGQGFTNAQAIKSAAKEHFGGNDQAMMGAVATVRANQAAQEMKTAENYGMSPERFGNIVGHLNALNTVGKSRALNTVGDKGAISASTGQMMQTAAKYDMARQAAGVAGGFDTNGDDQIDNSELYGFLQSTEGNFSMAMNDDQAKSVGLEGGGGAVNFSLPPGGSEPVLTRANRGRSENDYDISQSESGSISNNYMKDNPLNIDPPSALKKVQEMDPALTNSLLSGSPESQQTSARNLSKALSEGLFYRKHGVDSDQLDGGAGLGQKVLNTGGGTEPSMKNMIGGILSKMPHSNISFSKASSYREQIDKNAMEFYNQISGVQEAVRDGIFTKEKGEEILAVQLKGMTRDMQTHETISDETRRGFDKTYLQDKR